jgi:hypothetical protein
VLLTQKWVNVLSTDDWALAELADETLDLGLHLFPSKDKTYGQCGRTLSIGD